MNKELILNIPVIYNKTLNSKNFLIDSSYLQPNENTVFVLLKYLVNSEDKLNYLYNYELSDYHDIDSTFTNRNTFIKNLINKYNQNPKRMFFAMDNTKNTHKEKTEELWNSNEIEFEILDINSYIKFKYWIVSCPRDKFLDFEIHRYELYPDEKLKIKMASIFRSNNIIEKNSILNNNKRANHPIVWDNKDVLLEDIILPYKNSLDKLKEINDELYTSLNNFSIKPIIFYKGFTNE